MIGIATITAALVILLSAFNGIEAMIEKLYSDFDTDITIRPSQGKTFPLSQIDLNKLQAISGVHAVSRAIEEVVVVKHEKKWVNANLTGIDSSFLTMSHMHKHLVEGKDEIFIQGGNFILTGATLLDKLGGFIPVQTGYEQVIIYAPKRDAKVRIGSNPFTTSIVNVAGKMNFNKEVNAQAIVMPFENASDLLNYNAQASAIYIDLQNNISVEEVREQLKKQLGSDFIVKTNYEKNELIYKTSKSEKLIVLIILLFVFILAAFNLVASLTMLFVEKKDNISTLIAIGMNRQQVSKIFLFEGFLIAGKGIISGLILGYGICVLQLQYKLLQMPNSGGEPFPIRLSLTDGSIIILLVSLLSMIFTYLPVRYLIKRNFSHIQF